MKITIIFGSNSGDKQQLIEKAIAILSAKTGKIIMTSSFYETEPWGFECPELFLNQVSVFETDLTPEEFLQHCLDTEQHLGRVRPVSGPRYSSRPIDIDILFCEHHVLNTPRLTVPHPRLCERNFVLVPLGEIMPDFIHPVLGKKISELIVACEDKGEVRIAPNRFP